MNELITCDSYSSNTLLKKQDQHIIYYLDYILFFKLYFLILNIELIIYAHYILFLFILPSNPLEKLCNYQFQTPIEQLTLQVLICHKKSPLLQFSLGYGKVIILCRKMDFELVSIQFNIRS